MSQRVLFVPIKVFVFHCPHEPLNFFMTNGDVPYSRPSLCQCHSTENDYCQKKNLDGICRIDNKPSTNKLQHFVKKNEKIEKIDMWHVTLDMWHMTRDTKTNQCLNIFFIWIMDNRQKDRGTSITWFGPGLESGPSEYTGIKHIPNNIHTYNILVKMHQTGMKINNAGEIVLGLCISPASLITFGFILHNFAMRYSFLLT